MSEPPIVQTVAGDGNTVAGRDVIITNNYAAPQAAERASLLVLLGKVKVDWINGFLKQALHQQTALEVEKEFCAAEVQRPWDSVRETLEQPKEDLASGKSMAEIYDATARALLILGEPGSGKTIAMLKLAQTLVERAEKDASEPIPTILNLSTWTDKMKGLFNWLARELSARYYVGKRLAETWLKEGRLVLLLDGLDEVQPEYQTGCVLAINAFVKDSGVPGLVVSCRAGDYRALNQKLNLNGAVMLQPLAFENSTKYLADCGSKLTGLIQAMQADQELRELAASPLMLHIMAIAYAGQSTEMIGRDGAGSRPNRKQELLEAYVEVAFERKKKLASAYAKDQTLFWLRWLADKARRQSQTIISLERLQPSWLETRAQICFYLLFSRLTVGLVLAIMVFYCFKGTNLSYALTVGSFCTLVGLVDVFRLLLWPKPIDRTRMGVLYVTGCAVCFTATYFLLTQIIPNPRASFAETVYDVGFMSLLYGLFFWLRSRNRDLNSDIKTVEVVRWSWRSGWQVAKTWTLWIAGVVFAVMLVCVFLFAEKFKLDKSLGPVKTVFVYVLAVVVCSLIVGMYFGVVALLLGGIKSGIREGKGILNQGIMLTLKNSLRLTCGLSFAFACFVAGANLLFSLLSRQNPGAYLAGRLSGMYVLVLDFAIAVWMGFGAIDVLNHYFLRLMATGVGYMPLRYAHFLNYASKLRLLQKVGGSYLFTHRLLLEHLADQYVRPPAPVPTEKPASN